MIGLKDAEALKLALSDTADNASWKEMTSDSCVGFLPICIIVRNEGQVCRTRSTLETDVSSPINADALLALRQNSMSLSTRRVVQGHMTMPARRHAAATFHHYGILGRIMIHLSP